MARRIPAISIASSEPPTSFMSSDLGATGGVVAHLRLLLPGLRGRAGRGRWLARRQPFQHKDLSHPLLYRLCRKAAISCARGHVARHDRGGGDLRALPDRDVIIHADA